MPLPDNFHPLMKSSAPKKQRVAPATKGSPQRCDQLSAVLLAGGRATRMGGVDKGLMRFLDAPLAVRICAALQPQVAELILNANRNLARYRRLGYRVIEDELVGHQGPLAGMRAALREAAHPWLLTIPCDGPFVASDYAERMIAAAQRQKVKLAVAHDGQRAQPVYSLIHRDLAPSLAQFLTSGERKIDRWQQQHTPATVDFSHDQAMFTNINTPQQLAELEQQAGG